MPLYMQLAQDLEEQILRGTLGPGHAVPSEAELVAAYGVARVTARGAVRVLRERGLVYTKPGQGSFVGPPDAPRVTRARLKHKEVAEEIARRIRAGVYKPDNPIPSLKQMSQEFAVAIGTARSAVELLRQWGLVYTVPQRGTYVSGGPLDPAAGNAS